MEDQEVRTLQTEISKVLAEAFCLFVKNFTGISGSTHEAQETENHIDPEDDIFVSLFFTGQVHGEFIFGTKKEYIFSLLNLESNNGDHLNAVLDFLSEAANVAAGHGLKVVGDKYNKVTLTAPKTILGTLKLPPTMHVSRHEANCGNQRINCYSYIDLMRLDLAVSFKETIGKLRSTYRDLSHAKAEIETSEQEKQELQRLGEAKTQFLANMSHELRTPLNGMIGMLDLVKRTELTPEQREQIDIVSQSGDFLLSIINDILEFSKIESGKLVIECIEFDFRKCIDDLVAVLANEAFKKGLELYVYIDSRLPKYVATDQTRVRQILTNLIGNAIKFTPAGEVLVEITIKDFAKDSDSAIINFSVSDTGIGIPADKMEKIFFSFSQADTSDTRKYGGSGLGLSISKNIVEAMGGTLTATSKEASGSKFQFEIPIWLIKQATEPIANQESVLFLASSTRQNQILRHYLESMGFRPTEAKSLDHLLDSLTKTPDQAVNVLVDGALIKDTKSFKEKYISINHKKAYLCVLGPLLNLQNFKEMLSQMKRGYFLQKPIRYDELKNVLFTKPDFAVQSNVKIVPQKLASIETKGKSILLVEDNRTNQKVAKLMLESAGWKCTLADNGKVAVSKISEGTHFDVILMDCQMPEMDGFDATKEIRRIEIAKGKHTPIIAMTANAFRETKERCFASGMDNFITKPIKLETLIELINNTLLKLKSA